MRFLPYGRQTIEEDDIAAVSEVLRGDCLTTGPAVPAFEAAFGHAVGARYAVACSSGTAGLHLAAMSLGLGPGEAAIVPSLTFVATANAVRLTGAEVVFADVDPDTGLMEPDHLEQAMSRSGDLRVRAVFPVHLNGQCVDMSGVAEIAKTHGLHIVEDACHALGGRVLAEGGAMAPVGACIASDMAMFSLHPVKAIAMGEGGVVVTNHEVLAERLGRLRNHGLLRDSARFENAALATTQSGEPNPWYYEMPEIGLNYRASDIHCALGLSQLRKLDRFMARRRQIAELYDTVLDSLAPIVRPVSRVPGCDSGWHLYVVLIDFEAAGIERGTLMNRLRNAGIGTQVHYMPVHRQPYYRSRYGDIDLPGTIAYYDHCLSLPIHLNMSDENVRHVAATLAGALD